MKTWLGLVGLVAMASACGTSVEGAGASTNADTTTPAVDPDYELFATRADAEAFIARHIDDIFGDKPVPADDPRTVRVQGLLDKHWPAVVAKYHPTLAKPFVFVVDDDATVNAMAMFDGTADKALNIIYVYSGILRFSDADLEATLLHETGHLATKNGIQRYAQALTKYRRADPAAEGVGIAVPNDPATQAILDPYMHNVFTVGRTDVGEMDGVPYGDMAGMSVIFGDYIAAHEVASNPECTKLASARSAADRVVKASRTPFDGSLSFTPESAAALTAAASAVEATSLTCLKPPADVDLDAAMAAMFDFPPGSFKQAHPDQAPLLVGKDAMTGLFAFTRDLYARDRAFEATPDFGRYRQYSGEEQADDFALTVMYAEGADLQMMTNLFLDFAQMRGGDWKEQCVTMLANGTVPPYDLVEPHHGDCYRAYHVGKFHDYLAAGGEGVVIPSIPPPVAATAKRQLGPFDPKPWKNSTAAR